MARFRCASFTESAHPRVDPSLRSTRDSSPRSRSRRGSRAPGPRGEERSKETEMDELMGRAHAALLSERGQGTVEYVGLVLLIAALLAGVIAIGDSMKGGGIAETVVKKIKDTIDGPKTKA